MWYVIFIRWDPTRKLTVVLLDLFPMEMHINHLLTLLAFVFDCLLIIFTLNNRGYCIYHLLYRTKALHSAHEVYLCVSYGSHKKQLLFR
jgi:hypothetical protein